MGSTLKITFFYRFFKSHSNLLISIKDKTGNKKNSVIVSYIHINCKNIKSIQYYLQ